MNLRVITLIIALVVTGIAGSTFITDAQAASRQSVTDRLDRVKAYRADRGALRDQIESRMAELRSRLDSDSEDGSAKDGSSGNTSTKEKSDDDSDRNSDDNNAKSEPREESRQAESEPEDSQSDDAPASISEVAEAIHELTNAERRKHGVAPLSWDNSLANISTGHSKDMARKNYFSHTNRSGCSPSCRAKNAGYDYYAYGENIAMGTNSGDVAARFMKGWMNSSGHRKNILNGNYTEEGIGVAIANGKIYVTANFADPR